MNTHAVLSALLAAICAYTAVAALLARRRGRTLEVLRPDGRPVPMKSVLQAAARHRQALLDVVVRALSLRRWLELDMMRLKLQRAGRRHRHAESAFLLARFVNALGFSTLTALYLLFIAADRPPLLLIAAATAVATWLGLKVPVFALEREARARVASIRSAWPDALDLMVIMLATGRTIDATWRRVAEDIAPRSQALAEELNITLLELSFLPERHTAYENLALRVDLPEVRSACMAISQADEHGTAIAATLRALAQEGRAARIHSAEEKAGKASVYMAVPLVLFFLPPLAVLATIPSLINFMKWN